MGEYRRDQTVLRKAITTLLWHMRSLGREEAWTMCPQEREDAMKFIEGRIKIVEKTGLALL